jgi:hypothetical protein
MEAKTRTTYSSYIIPNALPTESKIEITMEKYTLGDFSGNLFIKYFGSDKVAFL